MPGKRREGVVFRGFPIELVLWEKAKEKANAEGRSVASVLQEALREYVTTGAPPTGPQPPAPAGTATPPS